MPTIERLDYPPERVAPMGYPDGLQSILMENPTNDGMTMQTQMRLGACAKEPWTVAVIEQALPGETVWDIGANAGSYSLVAAKRGSPVVALEPMSANFAQLTKNLRMNLGLDKRPLSERVIALPFGLSNTTRLDWLNLSSAQPHAAGHQIGKGPGDIPTKFHRELIVLWAMDELISSFGLPIPHVVKIDVDGHELELLAGAQKALLQTRLAIVEMPLQTETKITENLAALGLKLTDRYDRRGGQPISGICYGRFERA